MKRADVARAVACATACAVAAGGCACESRIAITGDTGDTDVVLDGLDVEWSDGTDTWSDVSIEGWEPSIEDLGESGWEESAVPWCPGTPETMAPYDLWSTPGSVFVLTSYSYYDHATGIGYEENYIYRNSGMAWVLTFEEHGLYCGAFVEFTGFSDAKLLLLDNDTSTCALTVIEGGSESCAFSELGNVQDVFVVNDNLAYAIKDERVIYYDASVIG